MSRVIPEIAEQSRLLVMFLKDRTSATYDELSAVVKEPVNRGRGYGWLDRARKILLRDHRQVWDAERGVGIKLSGVEVVIDGAQAEVAKMHRSARRGIRRLETLDFDKVEGPQRQQLLTTASHLAVLHHVTSTKQQKHLGAAVSAASVQLPLEKTLAAFQANAK